MFENTKNKPKKRPGTAIFKPRVHLFGQYCLNWRGQMFDARF